MQAAINAASDGDTLWVEADGVTNVESFTVTKDNLTIRAAEPGQGCGMASSGGANAIFQAQPGHPTLTIGYEIPLHSLKLIDITLSGGSSDAGGNIRGKYLYPNFNLLIFGSAMFNGDSGSDGGGIYLDSTNGFVYAMDTSFFVNRAAESGGAIAVPNGPDARVLLEGDTLVSVSRADGLAVNASGGGAVYVAGAFEMSDDAQIANAQHMGGGNGGCVVAGDVVLEDNAVLYNCSSEGDGGAVYAYSLTMSDSAGIREGTAAGDGGLVHAAEVVLSGNVALEDGVSQGNGGLVYLDTNALHDTRLETFATTGEILLRGGTAVDGAGIYAPYVNGVAPELILRDGVVMKGNEASGFGGAIFLSGGTLDVTGNVHIGDIDAVERNVAMSGAGIYAEDQSVVTLGTPTLARDEDAWRLDLSSFQPRSEYGIHITQNNATYSGAGIELSASTLTGYQPAIYSNRAVGAEDGGYGGGIAATSGSMVTLQEFHMGYNRARRRGGAIYASNSDLFLGYPQSDAKCWVEYENSGTGVAHRYCNEFIGNEAGRALMPTLGHGGAVYATGSQVDISTVGFVQNGANVSGVHMEVDGSSSVHVERSLFSDVSDAWASTQGVLVEAGGEIEASLNTFAGRGATLEVQAGATGLVDFNVFWPDGQVGSGVVLGGSLNGFCNVGLGVATLTGSSNLAVDPTFATTLRGPYRIPLTSVVKDHCPSSVPMAVLTGAYFDWEYVDLDGVSNTGVSGNPVDPGAFEAQ